MDTDNEGKTLEEIVAGGVPGGAKVTREPDDAPAIQLIAHKLMKREPTLSLEDALAAARQAPADVVAEAERELVTGGRPVNAASSPTMPWGPGPRPADWKDPSGAAGDDLLAALEAEPALVEQETCGVQFTDARRAYPERCQLPKDHAPSPGHRHGNIGWWR